MVEGEDFPLSQEEFGKIKDCIREIDQEADERAAYGKQRLDELEMHLSRAVEVVERIKAEYNNSGYLGRYVPFSNESGIPLLSELLAQVQLAKKEQKKILPKTQFTKTLVGGKKGVFEKRVAGFVIDEYLNIHDIKKKHGLSIYKAWQFPCRNEKNETSVDEILEEYGAEDSIRDSLRELLVKDAETERRRKDLDTFRHRADRGRKDLKKMGLYDEAISFVRDCFR